MKAICHTIKYKTWTADGVTLMNTVNEIIVVADRAKAAKAIFKEHYPNTEIQSMETMQCLTQE
jgi:hypothetical protein